MTEDSPMPASGTSPLRAFLTEMHEMYSELVDVGFPAEVANTVIAKILYDSIIRGSSTYEVEFDDDDEDDSDEGTDTTDDRGIG